MRFRESIDRIFKDIISRNFQQLEANPEFFIFKQNQNDKALVRELGTPSRKAINIESGQNQRTDSEFYQKDLLGTKDSYSDAEDEEERKPIRNLTEIISVEEIYNSCKKLLFKVNLVIKDCNGKKIIDTRLDKLSEVYDRYSQQIEQVCQQLVEKVKYLEDEKQIAYDNDAILSSIKLIESFRDNSTMMFDNDQRINEQCDTSNIQSSIEIYFSFFTIPQYVGLIRDQDVDFICQEKDEILVNDDDHEDLIRIAKLMDYFGYGSKTSKRIENEEIRLHELIKRFNKKQLIKSIPYYFKNTDNYQNYLEKDYKVYQFDEIQRKIIYGIIRRYYALLAQDLLEYATLIRPIDQLNLALTQKYMGSLLHNQRNTINFTVLSGLGNKLQHAHQILKDDLIRSNILNVSIIKDNENEIFFMKSSSKCRNFRNKVLKDSGKEREEILNSDKEVIDEEDIKKRGLELSNILQTNDECFEIKFWLLFKIVECPDDQGSLQVNITYHLPLYKQHQELNFTVVENEIQRCFKDIGIRVKIIMLLQQVDDTRLLHPSLILPEAVHQRTDANNSQLKNNEHPKFQSYSMLHNQMMQARIDNAKIMMGNKPDQNPSPLNLNKQGSQILVEKQQQKPSAISSKFRARMEKLSKQTKSKEMDNIQSDGNSNLDTKVEQKDSFQNFEQFKIDLVYKHVFHMQHSSLKVDEALKTISDMTFPNFQIYDQPNLFVIKRDNDVILLRMSSFQNDQPFQSNAFSLLKSQQNLNFNHLSAHPQDASNSQDEATPLNSRIHKTTMGSIAQNNMNKSNFSNENKILMEVFGCYKPQAEHIEPLTHIIQHNLKRVIIEKIAKTTHRTQGVLTQEDLNYIRQSDQKIIIAFPVSDQVSDPYAFMNYLKQTLSRFMLQVQLKQESHPLPYSSLSGTFQGKNFASNLIKQESFGMTQISEQNSESRQKRNYSMASNDDSVPQSLKIEKGSNHLLSTSLQECNLFFRHNNIKDAYDESPQQISETYEDRKSIDQPELNGEFNQQQIPYKREDFQLLYNYELTLGKPKLDQKRPQFTIKSIFDQSLVLSTLSIFERFPSKLYDIEKNNQPDIVKNIQDGVSIIETQKKSSNQRIYESIQNSKKLSFLASLIEQTKSTYGMIQGTNVEDLSFQPQMPLIFKFTREYHCQDDNQSYKASVLNDDYGVPKMASAHYGQTNWLVIKLNIIGKLQEELFIQNLILNFNQALNETLIESYLASHHNSSFKSTNEVQALDVKIDSNQEICLDKSQFSLYLEGLEKLMQQGSITQSNILQNFEKLIYGDPFDFSLSLIFTFITQFHQEFKAIAQKAKSLIKHPTNNQIIILVELVNKSANKIEKTYLFQIVKDCQSYEQIFKDIKQTVSKPQTILRNIHPQFKLILGSIKMIQDWMTPDTNLIFKQYQNDQVLQLDGLKPDSDKLEFAQGGLQSYPDIFKQLLSIDTTELSLQYQRNYFMILSIRDSKLNFKSYNLEKQVLKYSKTLINNALLWHSNRQELFKRVISQKIGTVYSLKAFYNSKYLIKDMNVRSLFGSDRFTFEEPAKIIEGKQIYNFQKQINRSKSKKKGKQSSKRKIEDPIIPQCSNKAESYLKNLDTSPLITVLRELYKKTVLKGDNISETTDQIDQMKKKSSQDLRTVAQTKLLLNKISQRKFERAFIEDENESVGNDTAKRALNLKQVIEFKELIQNKTATQVFKKMSAKQELYLTNLFMISPSITPSRFDRIICEKEKLLKQQIARNQHSHQLSPGKYSTDERICQSELSEKALFINPLFFHGTKIYRLIVGFYSRVQLARKTAFVYKRCDMPVQYQANLPMKLKMNKDLITEVINHFSSTKNISNQNMIPIIKRILNQATLLFSTSTTQLFDGAMKMATDKAGDDIEMSFNLLYGGRHESDYKKSKLHEKSLTLTQKEGPLTTTNKQQVEEMRVEFFDLYSKFLQQKASAQEIFQGRSNNINNAIKSMNISQRKMISKHNMNNSTHSIKRAGYDESRFFMKKLKRSNKFSEDFGSQGNITNDKIVEVASNSSLVPSQNQKDEQAIFQQRRQERVLQNFQNSESQKIEQHNYIIKAVNDKILVYQLSYVQGLIRVNVYSIDDILSLFPFQIMMHQKVVKSRKMVKERKKDNARQLVSFSTKLNTDSFNYDFHTSQIIKMVKFPEKKKKDFDLSQVIYNILSFYKTPPKYSKNYMDTVVLKVDLGFLNKISDMEFMQHFFSKLDKFEFKPFSFKNSLSAQAMFNSTFNQSVMLLDRRLTVDFSQESPNKHAFYLYTQSGPVSKVDQPISQQNQQPKQKHHKMLSQGQLKSSGGLKHNLTQGNLSCVFEGEDEDENTTKDQISKNSKNQQRDKQASKHKGKLQQPNISFQDTAQSQLDKNIKKLYMVELRNPIIHDEIGLSSEVFKKVWRLQCKKQEQSDSQINMDNQDEIDGIDNESKKTIIDLVFYYICVEENNQLQNVTEDKPRKNSERYPIREVSADMFNFITILKNAFTECRKDLIKDQLWTKFFDQTKEKQLTDIQLDDMLKFSYSYDLKVIDERYRELFETKQYYKTFYEYVKLLLKSQCMLFKKNMVYVGGLNERETGFMNFLIFNPEIKHFLIHVELNIQQRTINGWLVRKENDASLVKMDKDESVCSINRLKAIAILDEEEAQLVRKVINICAYWIWRKSV